MNSTTVKLYVKQLTYDNERQKFWTAFKNHFTATI